MRSRAELTPGEAKVEQFLSDLAVNGRVAAATQNQAFNALLFLYREVLHEPFENVQAVRAKRPIRVPTVLTPEEVKRVIEAMSGTPQLVVKLLYGSGLRLLEGLRLRVKDLDFEMKQLTVRDGKGANYAKVVVMQRGRLGDGDDLNLSLCLAEGWGSRKAGEICEKPAICGFRFDKATVQERLGSAAHGRQLPWHNSHRLRLRFVCAGIRRVGDTAPRFSR
jgi:site-specific recombinase XerC